MDNEHKFKDYIYWGVTAFCVIAGSIAFGYFLLRIDQVKKFGLMLLTVLMPVIYGAVIVIVLLVQVFQSAGTHLVNRMDRRTAAGQKQRKSH